MPRPRTLALSSLTPRTFEMFAPQPKLHLHPSPQAVHRTRHHGGELQMFRLSLYVVGISAFVAACAIYRSEQRKKPMPVTKAAEMLQEAWADHHTRA
jgi:hypothetical protein